jgi:hypothetical protein
MDMEIYDRLLKNLLIYANSDYCDNINSVKMKIKNDYLLIKKSKNEIDKIYCRHIKKELGKNFLQNN